MKLNGYSGLAILVTIFLFYFIHFTSSRQIRVISTSNQPSTNEDIVKVIGTVPESSFITQPAVITTGVTQLQTNDQQSKEASQTTPIHQAQNVGCAPQDGQINNPQLNSPSEQKSPCVQTQGKNAAGIITSDSVQTNSAKVTEANENKAETPKQQETAETPKQQETAEAPKQQETAETPKQQETAETPKQQETAETPKQQETAEKPKQETAEIPKQQKTAETPKQQEITETTKQQETAETPKQQETAEKPKQQEETTTTSQEKENEEESKEVVKVEPLEKEKLKQNEAKKEDTKKEKEETTVEETKTEEQKEEVTVKEKEEEGSKTNKQQEKTTVDIDSLLAKVTGRKICQSPHCKAVSQSIQDSLNKSADPCDNYYDYACGKWIKEHKIPKFHSQFSRISELSENNEKILMDSLKKDQITDNDTLKKIKLFYRSCMDRGSIEKEGIEPLQHYVDKLGSWNIDKDWESKDWNFYKTLTQMHRQYPAEVFFTVDVHTDPAAKDHANAEFIILIDQATLNLPQIIYFTSRKIIKLVSNYMARIINLSGCPEKTAFEKVRDIMKFETKLATISVPKIAKKYVRIDVAKLSQAIPEFPWIQHLQGIFAPKNVTNDTKVIVLANDYLPNMFELLKKTDKSILSNYMVWRLVKDVVPLLPRKFRREHFFLKKKLLGVKKDKPRERKCFGYANNLLGPLMGALFVKNAFSPESKHKVETMMEGIIKAFKDNIEHVDWVDKDTVVAVEKKADNAVYKVGYPDYLWDEKSFNRRYGMLNISRGHWFDNVLETDKFASLQTFQKLNTVSDKHQWITVPHLVNAFYVITKNEIVIPAGILQPPFFYPEEVPRSLSYGAIGHVLGHELTHGFDTTGRKYDKNGEEIDPANHTNTWSNSSIKAFEKRAKCLVEQFSDYKILGKFHIDGLKTLGENIADGGGVKLAFHAFRDFLETHQDEEILPDLNMPHEELFFLGYAQKECVRTSPAAEFLAVMEDVHPLSKYRVIGTLSNMDEFSDVYKCKKGSRMNPVKKCEVW